MSGKNNSRHGDKQTGLLGGCHSDWWRCASDRAVWYGRVSERNSFSSIFGMRAETWCRVLHDGDGGERAERGLRSLRLCFK